MNENENAMQQAARRNRQERAYEIFEQTGDKDKMRTALKNGGTVDSFDTEFLNNVVKGGVRVGPSV